MIRVILVGTLLLDGMEAKAVLPGAERDGFYYALIRKPA